MALGISRVMDPDKFAKVLALAESSHQGEAQSALRAARIMLARAGLTFRDLAALTHAHGNRSGAVFGGSSWAAQQTAPIQPTALTELLAEAILDASTLRQQVLKLEAQIGGLKERVEELVEIVGSQRSELARQRMETKRWHQLARETAEQLWDVGKALENHRTSRKATDKRRTLIEMLRDPTTADWSDDEIARRAGTSCHAVRFWRSRLVKFINSQPRRCHGDRGRTPFQRLNGGGLRGLRSLRSLRSVRSIRSFPDDIKPR